MNYESKDAIQNLILLILLSTAGLIGYFALVYLSLYAHYWPDTQIITLIKGESLLYRFNKTGLITIQILSHILLLILPAFLLTKFRKNISTDLNYSGFEWKYLGYSCLFFICALPMISLMGSINQQIPLQDWMTDKENQIEILLKKILNFQSPLDWLLTIITVSIIPAIAEEWIFRGIIQNQVLKLFKNHWYALLISAIIFSAVHFQFAGFLPRFGLGLLLGIIYYHGKNLGYSIIIHGLFNGIQLMLMNFYGLDSLDNKNPELTALLPFSLLSIVICYYLFRILTNFNFDKNA